MTFSSPVVCTMELVAGQGRDEGWMDGTDKEKMDVPIAVEMGVNVEAVHWPCELVGSTTKAGQFRLVLSGYR